MLNNLRLQEIVQATQSLYPLKQKRQHQLYSSPYAAV